MLVQRMDRNGPSWTMCLLLLIRSRAGCSEEPTPLRSLLTCQVAKARRIGGAAAKCSNQTDLPLIFIDPI